MNNRMIAKASVVCTMVVLAAFAAGCGAVGMPDAGGSSTPASASGADASASKPVTLRFMWWGSEIRHKATLAAIDLYRQKHPNVTIEAEYQGYEGYLDKVKTQIAAKQAPDIMQLDQTWLEELTSKSEPLADISRLTEIDTSSFDEKLLQDFSLSSSKKTVGLPMGTNGYVLIYNKTITDKLGIDTSGSWDWDRVLAAAQKIRGSNPKGTFTYCVDKSYPPMLFDIVHTERTGARLKSGDLTMPWTKEELVETYALMKKLADNHVLPSAEECYAPSQDPNPKWVSGDAPFIIEFTSQIAKLKGQIPNSTIGIAALPQLNNGKDPGTLLKPSMVLSINTNSKSTGEAAKFVNWFLNDKEAAAILGDVRSVPASVAAKDYAIQAGKIDKDVGVAVDIVLKHQSKAITGLLNNSQIGAVQDDVLQKLLFNKSTPEQAADDYLKRVGDKLNELKAQKK
ncbi:ABC transporter substrate-binding protein [Paenibacillus oleatilyticus]|uniref:ABC transporter substrate-binding protein n=1 Tax=Paenibacillus oleatilyticus TaxID=2594886 RepID=UPI001C1FE0D1|nr:extracellular solute-binding protein [Paenibacillus oleatilyticus]MBU7317013.1 extracellular solute-binding protein [Paenibacillus oleatilyticus]